jgi:hypothetical protein
MVNKDGSLGARNDVHCVSIEHKMGIKASPTAVLQFGDHGGAVGYLVGQENRGLEYMFIMMNAARYGVGMQGIAIAERAYQRPCSTPATACKAAPWTAACRQRAIIHHPDVRRMLMTMRATTEACRAMASTAAAAYDAAHHHPDAQVRKDNATFYEFMVPLVKGYSTEMSLEVTSLGVQVHGGMGFIEETGAAQYYRDAKILTIYEGTTAIQANDLVGRKTTRDGGQTARGHCRADRKDRSGSDCQRHARGPGRGPAPGRARKAYLDVVDFVCSSAKASPNAVYAGSVPYLMLAGNLVAGWQMGRALLVAQELLQKGQDEAFMRAKIATAQFYAEHILVRAQGLRDGIVEGADSVTALPLDLF